jgi:hypothetical protein
VFAARFQIGEEIVSLNGCNVKSESDWAECFMDAIDANANGTGFCLDHSPFENDDRSCCEPDYSGPLLCFENSEQSGCAPISLIVKRSHGSCTNATRCIEGDCFIAQLQGAVLWDIVTTRERVYFLASPEEFWYSGKAFLRFSC